MLDAYRLLLHNTFNHFFSPMNRLICQFNENQCCICNANKSLETKWIGPQFGLDISQCANQIYRGSHHNTLLMFIEFQINNFKTRKCVNGRRQSCKHFYCVFYLRNCTIIINDEKAILRWAKIAKKFQFVRLSFLFNTLMSIFEDLNVYFHTYLVIWKILCKLTLREQSEPPTFDQWKCETLDPLDNIEFITSSFQFDSMDADAFQFNLFFIILRSLIFYYTEKIFNTKEVWKKLNSVNLHIYDIKNRLIRSRFSRVLHENFSCFRYENRIISYVWKKVLSRRIGRTKQVGSCVSGQINMLIR